MAQLFIKNFLQKLNEIKESENQKELIKLNSKIAYPESVKEIISWLNMPKAEKYIVREQIENLQKTITANFAKLKKEVQPGEE